MPAISELQHPLAHHQRQLSDTPWIGVQEDYQRIYGMGHIEIGLPKGMEPQSSPTARNNTVSVTGAMFGDEGKGRFVDNKISALTEKTSRVNVVRFQGGNNAGHTIEMPDGRRVALHVIPSGIMYEETRGIIDRGMAVHVEDLQTEMEYAEGIVGDLRGKVVLSESALLCTDLERAEEVLNRVKSGGAAEGGTGRGIGPTYAHHYDRSGLKIADLLGDDWRTKLERQYDRYAKEFAAYGLDLSNVNVPDFRKVKLEKEKADRTVGSKEEFLDRVEASRTWLLDRDMTTNTLPLHREIFHDSRQGVVFEGAQAVGLHPWLGSYPDVTASDTTGWGILAGTGYWRLTDVQQRIGVMKGPYTSSVGRRHPPTEIPLSRLDNNLPVNASAAQERGVFIRNTAREQGTTTGRWRDVAELDLANLSYNAAVGGFESLAVTMMDVARESDVIRVSTHYERHGKPAPYEPGMNYMREVTPVYSDLPGWDGTKCSEATSIDQFPPNALKYLSFLQARTDIPIVAVTAGPSREKLFPLRGYSVA